MTQPLPSSSLPAKALRLFEKTLRSNWQDGISLVELLDRVNKVAIHLVPEENGEHSRVKPQFTERSFRHYQTLGCIDPPQKSRKRARYHAGHFVQALLVRKLLWERVSSEQIAALMAGRSTEETKKILHEGVEFVARQGIDFSGGGTESVCDAPKLWKRFPVSPGVELHLLDEVTGFSGDLVQSLLGRIEAVLRRNL